MAEKKRAEDAVRERLEAARDSVIDKLGERNVRKISKIVKLSLILAVLLVVASFFIRVKSIEVVGDVTMFNEGDVIRAADISEGDMLILKSSGKIEKNIKKALPLAESIKVRKSLFGKVKITVEFADVYFYTKIGDLYYAFDDQLVVLDISDSRGKYSNYNAVYVRLPKVREPRLDEKLVFYDTVEETDAEGDPLYEVREEKFYTFTLDFLRLLKESGYHSESQAIDLEEKFNIELVYADKFLIKFGDSRNLDVKFRLLFEILAEGSMNYASKGVIDISDPSKAFARADDSLDFSKYID